MVTDINGFTQLCFTFKARHGTGKHLGMAAEQGFFTSLSENQSNGHSLLCLPEKMRRHCPADNMKLQRTAAGESDDSSLL